MRIKRLDSTFLNGPILPALLRFSAPVLCALLLQALYGAVDLWAVGTFCGEADVSAVATGSQTMLIVTGIVTGLSMGTTVMLGKKIGSRDDKGAADTIGTSICVFVLLSMILSVIMTAAASKIAVIMNTPAEAFEKTVHYIMICGAGQGMRAKWAMWTGMFTAVILGGAMSYLSFFHGDLLSRIFINELPAIHASAEFLKATAVECFILF